MFKKCIIAIFVMLLPLTATASAERGTTDDAKAMVERAIAFYDANGMDALVDAVMDKDNTDFHDRDLYVFVHVINGVFLAHGVNPNLIGADMRGFRDASGAHLGLAIHDVATKEGSGWTDYVWDNPKTGELEYKTTYVSRFGDDYFLGVGAYKQ